MNVNLGTECPTKTPLGWTYNRTQICFFFSFVVRMTRRTVGNLDPKEEDFPHLLQ